MKIEIDISDEKLQNLSPTAMTEVSKVSKLYMEGVLDEASRIETDRRTTNAIPEITAAIISDAAAYTKNFGIRKKKPKSQTFTQIVASIASIITGGLFDTDKFNDIVYVIVFLVVFLIAIVSTVYLIFNGNNNE